MCFILTGVMGSCSRSVFCGRFIGVSGIGRLGSGVVDLDDRCLCGSGLFDRDRVGSYRRKCCAC